MPAKGNVVSAEELFHQIWGDEYFSKSNNTITVHIRHLREKMGDSFEDPKYIKTIWGADIKLKANYSKPIKMAVTFIIELPYVLASFFDRCYLEWSICRLVCTFIHD